MATTRNVNYVGMFKVAGLGSLLLIVGTVILFFTKGINYGVDFRGGVEVMVKFSEKVELSELRELMKNNQVPLSQLQSIGDEAQNEFLLKLESDKGDLNAVSNQVSSVLTTEFGEAKFEILKNDIVGPKAGSELNFCL